MFKKIVIIVLLCIFCVSLVNAATVVVPSAQIANCYANEGEPSVLTLLLDDAKFGLSGYKMSIGFSKGGVAKINKITFPDWADKANNVVGVLPGQQITISAADLNRTVSSGSKNVPLVTLEISGIVQGTTSLKVDVIEMTNHWGKPISVTPYPYSSIIVYSIPPLQSHLNAPRDMNHDGLLDDFNGNRIIDIDDIVVFFRAWSLGTTEGLPVAPFDYNKNGRIDVNDIVVFFGKHWVNQ